MIVAGCFELTGVVVGALVGGLAGLSLGWLIAISVVAVGTSRTVYKALQPVKTFIKASDIEDQQAYTPYTEQTQLLDMQANEVKMGQGEHGKGKLMIRKSSLNILMVTARYFPYMGGIETHVHETARRLVTHGVNVTLLTTAPHSTTLPPKEEVIEGIHVLRVRAWPPQRDYYIAPEIYSIVEGGGWDIVHCQGCHTFVPPIAMLAARKAQIPYVLTFHTGGHSSKWRNSIRGMQWQLLRPLFAGAAKLIGVSHFETDYFRNLLGLPAHLFTVVPNGATLPNIMSPSESTSTQSLIVSVGRLERYKGHQHIITALPHIRKQLPDAKLLIVGIGPYEAALRALAQRVSVAEHVEIRAVPSGNRQEMAETLARARLVVLLSEYEAHPIAVMEALALRRPVLVTNTSGLQELAKQQFVRAVALGSTPEEIAVGALRQIQEPLIPTQLALPTWEDCTQQLLAVYNMSVRREQCVS
jgi:glycosyltransferase involved in cell wall biosynthesis